MNVLFTVRGPFKDSRGYHILLLIDIKAPVELGFDEAKPLIKNRILQQKREKIQRQIVANLMKNVKIEINEKVLSTFK